MTRIRIDREELLYQVDRQCKGRDLAPSFILDGIAITEDGEKITYSTLEKEHKMVREIFTAVEYGILSTLHEALGERVLFTAFYKFMHSRGPRGIGGTGMDNVLTQHVKNIRKKLLRHSLPYNIRTIKGRRGEVVGAYILERI